MDLVFKETKIFTSQINALLSDDEYRDFQCCLVENPAAGQDNLTAKQKKTLKELVREELQSNGVENG